MNRLASVAVGAVLLLVACGAEPNPCVEKGRLRFDRTAWIARQDPTGMLDDLVANHLAVGMPRAEVIELLGVPQDDEPQYVGYDTGCFVCCWLNIWFDEQGLLTRTHVEMY